MLKSAAATDWREWFPEACEPAFDLRRRLLLFQVERWRADVHSLEGPHYLGWNVWPWPVRPDAPAGGILCGSDGVCRGQVGLLFCLFRAAFQRTSSPISFGLRKISKLFIFDSPRVLVSFMCCPTFDLFTIVGRKWLKKIIHNLLN